MTKLRPPLSCEHALVTIAERIGWRTAARVARRSERTIRKWGDADIARGVPLDRAIELDLAFIAAGGDIAPFETWYRMRLQLARVEAAHALLLADVCIAERVAEAAIETGEALAAHMLAGRVGARAQDRHAATRETEEAIAALARTLLPCPQSAGIGDCRC